MVGGPIGLLLTKIQSDRGLAEITSSNITNAEVDGFTRKEAYVISNTTGNSGVSSVQLSAIQRNIDKALQAQVELENSRLGQASSLNNYYQKISNLLGTKASHGTFVHQLGEFTGAIRSIESLGPTGIQKHAIIEGGVTFCDTMNMVGKSILELRSLIDQEIVDCIRELNNTLTETMEVNTEIAQLSLQRISTVNLQDKRDMTLHTMSELLNIQVSSDINDQVIISSEMGRLLTARRQTYMYSYDPSVVSSPGQKLNHIYYAGTPGVPGSGADVTGEFKTGKIAALLELRDQVLVDFQAEMDELSQVVRDSVNALHNSGTSYGGGGTLTGSKALYGVVDINGNNILPQGATAIDGQGTIRIGVSNKMGTLIDYKDIVLTDGMTIGGLVTQIMTGTNYTNSGGGGATAGGGFTVQQLATGELQISADTVGNTITLGSIGNPPAQISASTLTSTGFDSTRALGFSHFFGLNNFFSTGSQVYSSSNQIGLCNVLEVNPALVLNNSNLSVGQLAGTSVVTGDVSIASQIGDCLIKNDLSFSQVGQQPSIITSATDYAARVFALIQSDISVAKSNFDYRQVTYDELATRAHDTSAVNPSDELLKLFEISTSQQISSKALAILQQMQNDLLSLIGR